MKKIMLGALLALISTSPLWADEGEQKVRAALQQLAPGLPVDSIHKSPAEGLYEVAFGAEVIYVTADGKYLLQGSLIDTATRANLTENARATGRKKILDTLPESEMVVFAPKEVKHTVTVFTDIDCGYCRKLHDEMDSYHAQGIKIRYVAYPRAGVGSGSYDKAVAVWCAEDQQAAMTRAKAGQPVESKDCDNPVEKQYQTARALNLSGTPALFLESGELVPGYVSADRLSQMLQDKN